MINNGLKLKNKFFEKSQKRRGFTLIELLVSMTAFFVILAVALEIFVVSLGGGQRLFGQQNVLDAGRYIMESMSKEIRMSKISEGNGGPYGSLTVWPESKGGQSFIYSFVNDSISRSGSVLNPSNLKITGQFYVIQQGLSQPRVIITMQIENITNNNSRKAKINLQTTVSSREYE